MTPRLVLALGVLVVSTSCARRVVTLHGQPATPVPRTAVAENMHRQIANAVDAGDGDIEVLGLRQRMAADPNNLDIRLRLAARYEVNGFPEVALEHYRLAVERFPNEEMAHLKLAQYLRSHGSGVEAGQVLERYLAAHPAAVEMHAWSGIMHDEIGDVGAGERAHRAAIAKADAPKAYLHNNLGQNLLLQGRNAEATEQFQIAVRLDPRSAVARNNLGVALAAQPEEAVLHLQSIAGAATAHNNMAAVLIEQGRYPDARRHLQIALGYKPDSAAALRNLALVAELDGEPAALGPPQAHSFWKRFGGAMERVFLTPDGKPAKPETASGGAAQAAARD